MVYQRVKPEEPSAPFEIIDAIIPHFTTQQIKLNVLLLFTYSVHILSFEYTQQSEWLICFEHMCVHVSHIPMKELLKKGRMKGTDEMYGPYSEADMAFVIARERQHEMTLSTLYGNKVC